MIDNLKHLGIDRIVLSFVNGIAWNRIAPKMRGWYLAGLRLAASGPVTCTMLTNELLTQPFASVTVARIV